MYRLLAVVAMLTIAACGGGGGGDGDSSGGGEEALSYTVAGSISGLSVSGLVLQNNGADDLVIAANASTFQFATPVIAGGSYNITVATQPAGLTCTVSNGTGTNVNAAITNATVACNAITHTIAGTISGLTTDGLVLRNNGADDLVIAANASTFQFATPVAAGSGYNVTVFVQPVGLTCTVSNGVGKNVSADIANIRIVCSAITFKIGGTITGLTKNGLVLQNNGGDNLTIAANATAFEFATQVAYGGGYAVTVLTQPTGQICLITNAEGNATSQVSDVALTCTEVVLSPSVATLALAVNDNTLNAALTGTPRQITITNTGTIAATGVLISEPTWPTGTTTTSTCGTTLAVGASCTITITPGLDATSDCHNGTAPTPGTITVSADDALDSTIDVVVLSYGCIYQQGFLFSIDDTTLDSGSIGGKVAALSDQTEIFWASNGISGPDSTTILGIDETSTTSSPSPSSPPYPVGTPAYIPCPGGCDGPCNTSNIVSYYNFNRTTGGSPPTPLTQYAAGVCRAISNGYSDWYLPAICELGYGSPACGDLSSPRLQNMQSNLVDNGLLLGVGSFNLSSTQVSSNPQYQVWVHFFTPNKSDVNQSGIQKIDTNDTQYRFRCVRGLTL